LAKLSKKRLHLYKQPPFVNLPAMLLFQNFLQYRLLLQLFGAKEPVFAIQLLFLALHSVFSSTAGRCRRIQ